MTFQTAHHTFLERRHPEVTKNLNLLSFVDPPEANTHFQNTRNHRKQLTVMQPTQGLIENVTEAENNIAGKMVANKAKRPDYLPVYVIKLLKDTGTKWITSCFRKIMSEGIPQDWKESKITPIYKQKGDPVDC